MSKIRLSKKHNKSAEEVDAIVEKLETELCQKFDLTSKRQGNCVAFGRKGIDGKLTLGDQQVDIDIKLGMMTSMFAPKIESTLKEKLDDYLG